MLCRLRVESFAIIDKVEIEFSEGFTVLSGETGAGKSILIDALIFALGAKASSDQVRTGAEYAEVEAVFETGGQKELAEFFGQQGLERDEEAILRRQMNAAGQKPRVDQFQVGFAVHALRVGRKAGGYLRPARLPDFA